MIRFAKKSAIVAALLAVTMLSTGCSSMIEKKENKEVGVSYDLTEMSMDDISAGIYIRNGDMLYQPYSGHSINVTNSTDKYETIKNKRFIWYTTQLQYVPELNTDGSIIYKSESTIPSEFSLEKFEKLCDTIGVKDITLDEQGQFVLKTASSSLKEGSDAATIFADYGSDAKLILDSINDIPIEASMINKAGAISGLELGKSYKLGFYLGTKYHEVTITADTTFYASKEMDSITKYDGTKLGYIVLRLPDLMEPGLYYLNGEGAFTYGGLVTADKGEADETVDVEETSSEAVAAAVEQEVTETLAIGNSFETTEAAEAVENSTEATSQ